jgi:hypothetical protein
MPQAEPLEDVGAPPPPAEDPTKDGNGEDIARAIAAAKRAAVRTCFEHELKETPQLTGTVVVELDLAPPNRIDGLRVSDDLNRPTFTRCVTSAMEGAIRSARRRGLGARALRAEPRAQVDLVRSPTAPGRRVSVAPLPDSRRPSATGKDARLRNCLLCCW